MIPGRADAPLNKLAKYAELISEAPTRAEYQLAAPILAALLPSQTPSRALRSPFATNEVRARARARELLRQSREFSQMMVANPLLAATILAPAIWCANEAGAVDFEGTLERRLAMGRAVLRRDSLRDICTAAGLSWHLRGVQASIPLLIEANEALRHAPELISALPREDREQRLWAIATVHAGYKAAPPAAHLLWAAQNAAALRGLTTRRPLSAHHLPDLWRCYRLRDFIEYMKTTAGQELGFSPHRNWHNVQQARENWQHHRAAIYTAQRFDEELRAAPDGELRRAAIQNAELAPDTPALPDAETPDGWHIVVMRTQTMLVEEGLRLRNCLGGFRGRYAIDELLRQNRAVASLRDPDGKSVACFEILCPKGRRKRHALVELLGVANKSIRRKPAVQAIESYIALLNEIAPDRRAELAKSGPFDMREAEAETLM